jgi:two-component system, OmpR family, phosphate regulon sensor histidine kinase PhoR
VEFFYFLGGLGIGLAVLGWWQSRLNIRLEKMLRVFNAQPLQSSGLERLATSITAQQVIIRELEQQLSFWQQILFAAPIAYLQVDEENQLFWSNQQADQLLGIEQRRDRSSQPLLLLQIVRSFELDQLIAQTRSQQQVSQRDWLYHPTSIGVGGNHAKIPLRGHALPLPQRQVGVFLEDRQEAVSLKLERDRWISDVAHELKTPLTSIRLVAETLQHRVDPGLRSWIDRLLNETIRLSILVQDLLELSRITVHPTQKLERKLLNLSELIRTAWVSLEPLSAHKDLWLDYVGPDPLLIVGDQAQLYRVILNLLDNSIKYSPAQSAVRVLAHSPERTATLAAESNPQEYLCLEVIDFGPGFPEQSLPHVFERFYRADLARSRMVVAEATQGVGSGSGLGLAIVEEILEAHRGRVLASNHPETGGAWLQVFLPLPTEPEISAIADPFPRTSV